MISALSIRAKKMYSTYVDPLVLISDIPWMKKEEIIVDSNSTGTIKEDT